MTMARFRTSRGWVKFPDRETRKKEEIKEIFKIVRKNLNNTLEQDGWMISRGGFVEALRKSITKSKRQVMQLQKKTHKVVTFKSSSGKKVSFKVRKG